MGRGTIAKSGLGAVKKIQQMKTKGMITEAHDKMNLFVLVILMSLSVCAIISPTIPRKFLGIHNNATLEVPLQGARGTLNFTLDDGFMIKSKHVTGVFFFHNDSGLEYWRHHFFTDAFDFLPLGSLGLTDDYCTSIKYFVSAMLSFGASYGFALILYLMYEAVGACLATRAKKDTGRKKCAKKDTDTRAKKDTDTRAKKDTGTRAKKYTDTVGTEVVTTKF